MGDFLKTHFNVCVYIYLFYVTLARVIFLSPISPWVGCDHQKKKKLSKDFLNDNFYFI